MEKNAWNINGNSWRPHIRDLRVEKLKNSKMTENKVLRIKSPTNGNAYPKSPKQNKTDCTIRFLFQVRWKKNSKIGFSPFSCKWIGRRATIELPVRSPALSRFDVFAWTQDVRLLFICTYKSVKLSRLFFLPQNYVFLPFHFLNKPKGIQVNVALKTSNSCSGLITQI